MRLTGVTCGKDRRGRRRDTRLPLQGAPERRRPDPDSSGESVTGPISDKPQHGLDVPFDSESAGIIVLTAAGLIAASNARALALFACASVDELRTLCQPVLKRLSAGLRPASVTAQQFELQVVTRPQPRKIVVSAHPLVGQGDWLLLTHAEGDARRTDDLLEQAARNQLLQRLYGTLRHDLHSPIQAILWTFDLLQKAALQAPVSAAPVGVSPVGSRWASEPMTGSWSIAIGTAALEYCPESQETDPMG